MKRDEIKDCALCSKPVASGGRFTFFRVKIERFVLDLGAIQRQVGLESVCGHPAIAAVLGPNEDLAQPLSEIQPVLICDGCAMEPHCLAAIAEAIQTT